MNHHCSIDIDVIGHELTHGVVQFEAGLEYSFQSGALNESFADVFGSLVKQRSLGQTVKQADWLIGVNVIIGDAYALRSMKQPGSAYINHPVLGDDPQPASMAKYKEMPEWDDSGGVHINSGIPNHAFYLLSMKLGGKAWEKAGKIWYDALCNTLRPTSNFAEAAEATARSAKQLFGAGSKEEKATKEAWSEVGL